MRFNPLPVIAGRQVNERKDSKVPCTFQCRPPFPFYGKPCEWCARRYEEAMDESHRAYQEERASIAWERILPATDREWRDHCDLVAPVVTMIRINDQLIVESE